MGPDSHQIWYALQAPPTTTIHKISTLALSPFPRSIDFIIKFLAFHAFYRKNRKHSIHFIIKSLSLSLSNHHVGLLVGRSCGQLVLSHFVCFFFAFLGYLKVEKCRYEYVMDVNAPAQIITDFFMVFLHAKKCFPERFIYKFFF